jgi:hypothetical protein
MTCFFFSSFKTLLTSTEGSSPVEFNVLTYFLLAGFEVTTIGRIWVTAEALAVLGKSRLGLVATVQLRRSAYTGGDAASALARLAFAIRDLPGQPAKNIWASFSPF